jgi:hypothetical protein
MEKESRLAFNIATDKVSELLREVFESEEN